MDLVKEIFKCYKLKEDNLLSFGFHYLNNQYHYSIILDDIEMKLEITIDLERKMNLILTDLNFSDEYTNYKVDAINNAFVNKVRKEIIDVLVKIRDACYLKEYFINEQSNRIANLIKEKYLIQPEFLFNDYPTYGIFRNQKTNKWFGIIMNIKKKKLDKISEEEVEIINLKVLKEQIATPRDNQSIYPAYHMNKHHWISVVLDNTLSDEFIMSIVDMSYALSN